MANKGYFVVNDGNRRHVAQQVFNTAAGDVVVIKEATRSLDQNALLWPLLQQVSRQVDWYGQKLTDEEWKDVFTAALKKQKVVPGLDGGFVVCGQRTSKMNKKDFSELLELIYAFGAEREVQFHETANKEAA